MAKYNYDLKTYKKEIEAIIAEVEALEKPGKTGVQKILRKFPKDGSELFSSDELIAGYREICEEKGEKPNKQVIFKNRLAVLRNL